MSNQQQQAQAIALFKKWSNDHVAQAQAQAQQK